MADYFWSRVPGNFVDKLTGEPSAGTFAGNTILWYETLIELMYDVVNQAVQTYGCPIHDCSWYADPVVKVIVECSVLYKPIYDSTIPSIGTIGADTPGVICNCKIHGVDGMRKTGKILLLSNGLNLGSVTVLDIP